MLQVELFKNLAHKFGCEDRLWECKSCIMPSNDHFCNLTTREALGLVSDLLHNFCRNALHADELLPCVYRSWMLVEEHELFAC